MPRHPLAGRPAPAETLIDPGSLARDYYSLRPDPDDPLQRVAFGTSGHRGSAARASFNERHILAITQAICESRTAAGVDGPLFLGIDTHALSEPARRTAIEVFAGNGVELVLEADLGFTPTPVISHAILAFNAGRRSGLADGVVITPSHNPPEDGGYKYNPPTGGPADAATTRAIEERANELLVEPGGIRRVPLERALGLATTTQRDLIGPYVVDLRSVVDLEKIAASGLRIGADPMGGSALPCWHRIAEVHSLPIQVVNDRIDPTFGFMPLDGDGRIRMDCSSPHAMAGLIELSQRYDIAFGNDPDADRHGIVTRSAGLMNPNHFLAVAADYLFRTRAGWGPSAGLGKTLVSSSMLDRVADAHQRRLVEVPVGFKWFVEGLADGSLGFAGEESAGASFLRFDGTVWTTDKDGIVLALLAAEITASTGRDPGHHYRLLEEIHGSPVYERTDAPASPAQKDALAALSPQMVTAEELAGEPITGKLTSAPGNGAPIGGLKVTTRNGWFAARPSGTEDVYKIYAESFVGADHLRRLQEEARDIVSTAFTAAGVAAEASTS